MKTRLRELRKQKALTQSALGERILTPQRAYSYYERGAGEVPLDVLCALADFYGVSVDYILYRTDDPRPYPPSTLRFD